MSWWLTAEKLFVSEQAQADVLERRARRTLRGESTSRDVKL